MDDEIKTILLWLFIAGPLIAFFTVGYWMFVWHMVTASKGNPIIILVGLCLAAGGLAILPILATQGIISNGVIMSNELVITLGWIVWGLFKAYGEKSG